MPDLSDIQHIYGDDVAVGPSGDFALVTQEQRTQLRIIRRLLTPATEIGSSPYPWQPEYGAGLGKKIGTTIDQRTVQSIVLSQMGLEPTVAKVPLPVVVVTPTAANDGAQIDINYTNLAGFPLSFSFTLGR